MGLVPVRVQAVRPPGLGVGIDVQPDDFIICLGTDDVVMEGFLPDGVIEVTYSFRCFTAGAHIRPCENNLVKYIARLVPYKLFAAFTAHGIVSPWRGEGTPPYRTFLCLPHIIK